jgi:hypothetical protein
MLGHPLSLPLQGESVINVCDTQQDNRWHPNPCAQFRKNRRVKLSLGLPITGAFLLPTFACREAVECDGLIADDQLEGIAKAKAAGIYKGRPASMDAAQVRAMKVCEGPQDREASVRHLNPEFNTRACAALDSLCLDGC